VYAAFREGRFAISPTQEVWHPCGVLGALPPLGFAHPSPPQIQVRQDSGSGSTDAIFLALWEAAN
jgi:hypothetical protein